MKQAEMEAFERHGGRLDRAMRAFPDAPRPWIDVSTGINPVAWTPPAGLVVDPGPLPSPDALRALEATAAGWFGTAPERVVAVPGSEIALRLLPLLGLPGPLAARRAGYRTHREVADAVLAGEGAEADAIGTLLLANPDNPDGRLLDRAAIDRLRARPGWLVLDEAFVDAVPGVSLVPALGDDDRVIVLRSFGKFFGLAGVRLGFAVAPPAVVARLRRLLGDWPIGVHALAWGRAAYADSAWIDRTRTSLAVAAARLDAVPTTHGGAVAGACPLFRLMTHPDAAGLFVRLAQAGILTRPFADRPDQLRFGLPPDDAAFDRLARVLARG